jgi:hypothetical protein
MPTMQDSVSVAANSVSSNQLSGQLYEFVPQGANVTVSCTGSATGLRVSFICGVPLIEDQAIGLQNRFPLIPDDVIHSGPVPGGRMVLKFRNSTGGALTAFWRVDV